MPLVKDGKRVADPWRHLEDAEIAPPRASVTVSAPRWRREREALLRHDGAIGLRLPNDTPATLLTRDDAARLGLITLHFPRFTDGRAYSQARLLRERLGYEGELRATGEVLRDQLLFMRRCGIDAFEVSERALSEGWLDAFADFDVFYQPATDGRPWIMRQRASAQLGPACADCD